MNLIPEIIMERANETFKPYPGFIDDIKHFQTGMDKTQGA